MMKHKNLKGMKSKIIIGLILILACGYASGQSGNIRGNSLWSHTTVAVDTSYSETGDEDIGARYWNSDEHTTNLTLPGGVVLQDGQELFFDVLNQTGGNLLNGYAAAFSGTVGASGKIVADYMIADYSVMPEATIGIFTETIANGEQGKVTWFGKVRGIQTNGANFGETWMDGDTLFVSPTTPGWLTHTQPQAPNPAILIAIVVKASATNGILQVRPTFPERLVDLADVNGTPLTKTGQFPVWINPRKVFDFNYQVNNDVYSSDWDGRDTMIPTFDNLYDKISLFESLNYCNDSIELNFGTISRGSQDSLCAVDGNLLGIAEVAPNPPWQIDFVFQNVERLQYFSFYGRYEGGVTHNIHVLAYNYNSASWDFIGEFGSSDISRWYSWPIFAPNNYINSGEVKVRVEHQGTGITSHRMYFDYVEVNFGGTGGGNFIEASAVDFMPYLNITSTNVQGAIQQFYDLWEDTTTVLRDDISALQAESHPVATLATDDAAILSLSGQDFTFDSSNLARRQLSSGWETGITNNEIGFNSSAIESPINTITHFGFLATLFGNNNYGGAFVMRNDRAFFQTRENTVLQGWREFYHTGNFSDNSTNWNAAYNHSIITSGNPHNIIYSEIPDTPNLDNYISSNSDDETSTGIRTFFGGAIPGLSTSGARVQVNGFQRTGDIYLHEGGATPTSASKIISNISGDLTWDSNVLYNESNANLSSIDWNANNIFYSGDIIKGSSIGYTSLNDLTVNYGSANAGIVINSSSIGRLSFGDGSLSAFIEYLHSSDVFRFRVGGIDARFTLNSSGDGTFAGKTISSGVETTTFKMTNGATDGYYLRSDASGNGTWQAITASQVYLGTLNGSTGTPTAGGSALIDGTGSAGGYYVAVVAGTYDYGNPSGNSITLAVGDQIYYNGSTWEKIPTSSGVTSVNGYTGAVTLYPQLSGNNLNIIGNATTIDIGNATDVAANTSSRHDAMTLTGSYGYITRSGQQLTLGQIDYTTDISNKPSTLPTSSTWQDVVDNGTPILTDTVNIKGGVFGTNTSNIFDVLTVYNSTGAESGISLIDPSNTMYGFRTYFSDTDNSYNIAGLINGITNDYFSINRDNGDAVFSSDVTIPADPYDATWGTLTEAAPKDAVYNKIESLSTASFSGVKAYITSNQDIGSGILVAFEAEDYDTDSYHNNLADSTEFVIPSTGYYRLTVNGDAYLSGGTLKVLQASIYVNSSPVRTFWDFNGTGDLNMYISASETFSLTSGDIVELYMGGATGTVIEATGNDRVYFSIEKL